jgi:predicted dehydrogenase
MSKTTIKWGILGTHKISETMAEAIQASSSSTLLAIGSRSLDKAKTFANQYAIPKIYDDYHALIKDPDIDAVYIATPNHLHKDWILNCAAAGKHILCEKPFVISVSEAREVITAVEKSNVRCMEALMYRHHPVISELQDLIQSGIIGDIKLYNATYTANIATLANPTAGGSIRNLGCYPVSLIRLLANAEPVEIIGMGRMHESNGTDNLATVMLKFRDESIATISTADDIEMVAQFNIYGSKGRIELLTNPWMPRRENNVIRIHLDAEESPREIIINADKPLYTYQIDALNSLIANKNDMPAISLTDSMENTRVLETWREQVTTMNIKVKVCA